MYLDVAGAENDQEGQNEEEMLGGAWVCANEQGKCMLKC